MKDCSISSANALEILQSCNKPLIYWWYTGHSLCCRHFHWKTHKDTRRGDRQDSLPVRVRYGVSLWVLSLTQLYHCNCCAVCKVVLYMSLIYQEFIVFSWYWSKCWVNLVFADGLVLVYYNTFTSHSRLAKLPYGLNIKCPWLDLAEDHFMNQILFLTEINPNIMKLALILNSEQGLGCNVAKLT